MARGNGSTACTEQAHPRARADAALAEPEFSHYVGAGQPRFGHPIEHDLACYLDAFGIDWAYEPHTYPLRARDTDGCEVVCCPDWLVDGELPDGYHLTEAFSPDFYLPGQNLYIETTVMLQRNITRKHRKIRHLKELYPDIRIKLFDRHDFERLATQHPAVFTHVPAHGVTDPYSQ